MTTQLQRTKTRKMQDLLRTSSLRSLTFILFAFLSAQFLYAQKKTEIKDLQVSNTRAVLLGTTAPVTDGSYRTTTKGKKLSKKKQKQSPPNFIGRGKSKVRVPELEHQGDDPIRQIGFSRKTTLIDPLVNIEGLRNGSVPHDPTGSTGLDRYVQAINSTQLGVYTKDGDLESTFAANSLWAPLGESSLGDPIILYAQESDQWIITEFADPALLLIAVSQTSDPLGDYSVYSFATPFFPDYPKYAIWDDFLIVTTNEEGPGDLHQYFLDKDALLAGEEEVRIQRIAIDGNFSTEAGFYVSTPVHWNGSSLPSDNNPIAVKINDSSWGEVATDVLEVFTFDVDLEDADNTTVTLLQLEATPFDSYPCDNESGGFACLSQGEGAGGLDAIPEVVMNIPHYRNFGTHESIVLNFITDVTDGNNLSGIRWMELRRTNGGNWEIYQEGTFAPDDGLHRYMGSIAIDESGNIGLGYVVSGPTTFAGLRFTGRFADDPLGEMTVQEAIIADGTNSLAFDRFGDYSHMTVDPVDGQTFWFTAEYGGGGSSGSTTRITSFQLEKKDNDLAVTEISSPETSGDLGASEAVVASVVNVGNLDATDFDIVLTLDDELIETFAYDQTLASGEEYEHTFATTVDLSTVGDYLLEVSVDYASDESNANNIKEKTVSKLAAVDAAISLEVESTTCLGSTDGVIRITNEGASDLTSAEIRTSVGGEVQETISWTGSLATGESDQIEVSFDGLVSGDNTLVAEIVTVNGSEDTVTENNSDEEVITVDDNLEFVSLILTTDDFPEETLWILENEDREIIFSGGPYNSTGTFTENFCLPTDQCYFFTIGDTAADGICCDFGQGSYQLVDSEGNIIFESNGQFGETEETGFCVGDVPQNDAAVAIFEVDEVVCTTDFISQVEILNLGEQPLTSVDLEIQVNGTVTDNFEWTGDLALGESDFFVFNYLGLTEGENAIVATVSNPNGVPDDGTGDNTDSESITVESDGELENLSLVILFDDFPDETSWELTNDSDDIVASGGPYPEFSGQIIESLCVAFDGCYELTFFDAFDDGICCDFGEGRYEVLDESGEVLVTSNGQFGTSESNNFCLDGACDLAIEVSKTNVIGDQLGVIMVTATGGSGTLAYSIDGGASSQQSGVFDDLSAGEYSVVVEDNSGCIAEQTVVIETECQLEIDVVSELTSNNSGTITITATGGLNYEYSIDGGVTFSASNSFEGLPSGDYEIVVQSNDGACTQELSLTVDFVLGTSDLLQDLVASPNPTNGLFTLSLSGHSYIEDFLTVEVFDINGKLIQARKFSRYDGQYRGEISLYSYPAGVYLLKPANIRSNKLIKVIKK